MNHSAAIESKSASVLFSDSGSTAQTIHIADDIYTASEAQIIASAFLAVSGVHQYIPTQIALMSNIMQELHANLAELRSLEESIRTGLASSHPSSKMMATVHAETLRMIELKQNYFITLKNYMSVLTTHMQTERRNVYYSLAKIQLPPGVPKSRERKQGVLCDSRCQLRLGLPGSSIVHQKCCGATACNSCLLEHNFVYSHNAFYFHAPCFHCSTPRGIFKHFTENVVASKAAQSNN